MIQRHQDYQLTIPSVPVGGVVGVPLRLDTDAPFFLRLVRSRNVGLSGFRFTTPRQSYQSSGFRTDCIPQLPNTLGNPQTGRGLVMYPQMLYPPGATILVDVGNETDAALTNAKILFRGSKLFAAGAVSDATYPAKIAPLPFTYPIVVPNVPSVGPPLRNVQLRIRTDADFVLRYGACDAFTLGVDGGPYNPFNFRDVSVILRDEYYKAFSNEPIHVNDLFGQGRPYNYGEAGANDDSVLFLPNLFTPEIYIRRDHSLYMDVYRNDPGLGPVDLHFRFQGAKVFTR